MSKQEVWTSKELKEKMLNRKPYTRKQVESLTQQACVQWFRAQYPHLARLLISIPNEGRRSKATASRMKAEGMVSGASDLILLIPNGKYGCFCLELKKGGQKPTKNQIDFWHDMESNGNKYSIIKSVDQFIKEVNEYLEEW